MLIPFRPQFPDPLPAEIRVQVPAVQILRVHQRGSFGFTGAVELVNPRDGAGYRLPAWVPTRPALFSR